MLLWQLRVPALSLYGFLAASSVLGIKGVCVVLVHLSLNFSVAQLQKPALSWVCNLLLLSTLHIQPLQDIQVRSSGRDLKVRICIFFNVKKLKIYRENSPRAARISTFQHEDLLLGVVLVEAARRRPRWGETSCCSCICRRVDKNRQEQRKFCSRTITQKLRW